MKGDDIADRIEAYAASVLSVILALPKNRVGKHIEDQLLRSGSAPGAHYSEARSAQSRRDFVYKVSLAGKEMRESVYWLGLVKRSQLISGQDISPIIQEGRELTAILLSSAKTAGTGSSNQVNRHL